MVLPNNINEDGRWYRQLERPAVYLTYDDGPNPSVTFPLLDILEGAGAAATFFVSGYAMLSDMHVRCLREIDARGHGIGNHGLVHERGCCPRFSEMHDRILDKCGVSTKLIRPPYGDRSIALPYMSEESEAVGFLWSALFHDWNPLDVRLVPAMFPKCLVPGAILLLHDGFVPGNAYTRRDQVISLTQLIVDNCRMTGIQLKSLACEFQNSYQSPHVPAN
ncbi:MAG: polysaccharide deacetylase family protein [Acidobacteria bacterium]|nr:polysaccharide deacetylase family protein [Acidobacteriota bacterium]